MDLTQLDPDEDLARYFCEKNKYKHSDQTARYQLFMPPRNDLRLSVYRIIGLIEHEIWEMGNQVFKNRSSRAIGRGDLKVHIVLKNELFIDPDNNPNRHASIINWPEDTDAQRLKAMDLARDTIIYLNDSEE